MWWVGVYIDGEMLVVTLIAYENSSDVGRKLFLKICNRKSYCFGIKGFAVADSDWNEDG